MMSNCSWPLWDHAYLAHEAVQFPWRLNQVLCVGTLALTALSFSAARGKAGIPKIIFSAAFLLVVGTWLYSYAEVWHHYKVDVDLGPQPEEQAINDHDGWLHAWLQPGTIQETALIASFGPKVRFDQSAGSAQLLVWKPRNIEIETASSSGGWVMVNQVYYPTWRAVVIDQGRPATVRPAMPEGLVEVETPPGNHRILIQIPISLAEQMGRWLSVLSMILCLILGIKRRVAKVPNAERARHAIESKSFATL